MSSYSEFAKQFIGARQGSRKHKNIIDFYNANIKPLPRGYKVTYLDNWCATFVSYILFNCGCRKKGVYECGAERMKRNMKKYLLEDKTKGKKDCIIFFDWQCNGWSDHVGIIDHVDDKYYYTIEGNKSKMVGTRKILKTSKYISGVAKV